MRVFFVHGRPKNLKFINLLCNNQSIITHSEQICFFYLASNIIYLHIMIPLIFYIHILCGFLYVLIRFIYVSPQHKGRILSQISEIELTVAF